MNTQEVLSPDSLYASLGRRLLAFILDAVILFLPCAIGGHLIPFIGGVIVWFFYAPILEASELRATLGKHLMGIQVVDTAGRRISLRASIIRNVLKFASSILLFIGFFFALFTARRQALHDILAETTVVYGRSSQPVADAWIATTRDLFQTHSPGSSHSTISQLERIQTLRDRGALTEEEFQEQKRRILG